MCNTNKISIDLPNNYKLIVERNQDNYYDKEVCIGIEDPNGVYWQDLVIVSPTYNYDGDKPKYNSDSFRILVFGKEHQEDYTEEFEVGLYKDE